MGNTPRVLAYGWDSVLLEVDDPAGWFRALTALREAGGLDCEEIVPAARTVLLRGVTTPPMSSASDRSRHRLTPGPSPSRSLGTATTWRRWPRCGARIHARA